MFLFTSIIEFTVPCTPSFSIRLLKKGSAGSSCRISFKEKLSGCLNQSNGSDRRRETETKNFDARAGHTSAAANDGPEPCTGISGKSFRSLMTTKVTSLTLALVSIISYIHPNIAYAIAASQHFVSCHEAVVASFDMSGN